MQTVSEEGLQFIAGWEGYRQYLYEDSGGHCTIGIGFKLHDGGCTQADYQKYAGGMSVGEALILFRQKIAYFEQCARDTVRVPLTQHQFDALVDFAYNAGCGGLQQLVRLSNLNTGNFSAVCSTMMRWVYSSGIYVPALKRRRDEDCALFHRIAEEEDDMPDLISWAFWRDRPPNIRFKSYDIYYGKDGLRKRIVPGPREHDAHTAAGLHLQGKSLQELKAIPSEPGTPEPDSP